MFDSNSQASERFDRLFAESQRQLSVAIKAIFANHIAKGHLRSGVTIKLVIRSIEILTNDAVTASLQSVDSRTEHAGRQRKSMVDTLEDRLNVHLDAATEIAKRAIAKIGIGDDFRHAEPMLAEAKARHEERIQDFLEGWTAPKPKTWIERNPFIYAVALLFAGAVIAWTFDTLMSG